MGEKGDYTISDVYQGGYSSFKPSYISTGYDPKISAGSLGMTTDPRTANILKEVSEKLSMGVKQIEIEGVSPEIFDSIPKQQLKEVNRLSKLTGIDVSMHGPVIDTAGFTQSGWSEVDREVAEKKVTETLLRSHELNPDGNIPVNFHSAEGIPGSQPLPPSKRKENEQYRKLIVVNRDTGRLAPLEPDIQYTPGGEIVEMKELTPERRLKNLNETEWENSLFQVEVNRENAERILQDVHPIIIERLLAKEGGKIDSSEISPEEFREMKKVASAHDFIEQAHLAVNSLFSKAYEVAKSDNDHEKMKQLSELSKAYGESMGVNGDKIEANKYYNPLVQANAIRGLLNGLKRIPPKTYVPIEEFAMGKSAQTYGNAAFKAYKEFKDKAPTLVIENPPAGFALSTGKDIKEIVEASRKQFVQNAVKDGMSEKAAQKQAEKFIGATWDVGHVNMLRKFGYSEEEIIKEAEHVAPYIKHVHLSDNFGIEHTELPMGMGNVPLKEIMEKLGQKGYEARKIIEASGWWQHFRAPPFQESLEGIGSPVYSMKMGPYWDQAPGLYQGYTEGLVGPWLPQVNYETFGTGFSRLPSDLGGARPGAGGSRMSGRPME